MSPHLSYRTCLEEQPPRHIARQYGAWPIWQPEPRIPDRPGEGEAAVEGGEGKIAFNSRYLSDVLAVIGERKVALEMTTSSSPGVIKPVDDDQYVHVVMPMFVQW